MNRYNKDYNSLSVKLQEGRKKVVESFYNEYKHQKEMLELEERLYKRIMDAFNIQVKDEATPIIEELSALIKNIMK